MTGPLNTPVFETIWWGTDASFRHVTLAPRGTVIDEGWNEYGAAVLGMVTVYEAAALDDAAVVLAATFAELVAVDAAGLGLGLGLGLDGVVHPAITRGATTSATVISKRYFFTFLTPTVV